MERGSDDEEFFDNQLDAIIAQTEAFIEIIYSVEPSAPVGLNNSPEGNAVAADDNSIGYNSPEDIEYGFPVPGGQVETRAGGVPAANDETQAGGVPGAQVETRAGGVPAAEAGDSSDSDEDEPDQANENDEEPPLFVDVLAILREVAGSNILFVEVDGLMEEHVRSGGYRNRTGLTHFFELPGCYDFSWAWLTKESEFTDAAHWLLRRRQLHMLARDYVMAKIRKFGYSTINAKSRSYEHKAKLEQSAFPMEEYLPRLEHIIINLPEGMLVHLEAEQNVRNNLSDEDVRAIWHANGVHYVSHRTARSEMIEVVNDGGYPERVERSFRDCVTSMALKNGGSVLEPEDNDRLVQEFTDRVIEEHRCVNQERLRRRALMRERDRQFRHNRALERIAALPTETERAEAIRGLEWREHVQARGRRQRAERQLSDAEREQRIRQRCQERQQQREDQRQERYNLELEEIASLPTQEEREDARRRLDQLEQRLRAERIAARLRRERSRGA